MKLLLSIVLFVGAVATAGGPQATSSGPQVAGGHKAAHVDVAHPTLEFAPLSGAGMPTSPCTCATPTGANGEALTFTRSTVGTCLKGNVASNIANGDMVTCSVNQPRIAYGGSGTGELKILIEPQRVNSTVRSQELDNGVWLQNADAAPRNTTVTADQAVAPDGTTTADQLDLIATTGAQFSSRAILAGCPAGGSTPSIFVKGVSGSGTIDIADNVVCGACTFNSTSWSRCIGGTSSAGGTQFSIGNYSVSCGVSRPTQSVYVWGMQCEAGKNVTSYIATAGATVTRTRDLATFSITGWAAGLSFSEAATWIAPTTIDPAESNFILEPSDGASNNRYDLFILNTTQLSSYFITGGSLSQINQTGLAAGASNRLAGAYDVLTSTQSACVGASCTNTVVAVVVPFAPTNLTVGGFFPGGGDEANGWVSQVCYDKNSSTRCR